MSQKNKNITQKFSFSDFYILSDQISSARTENEINDILISNFKNSIGVFELVFLFFDNNRVLNFNLNRKIGRDKILRVARKLEEDGIIDWAVNQRKAFIIPNMAAESDFEKSFLLLDTVYSSEDMPFSILIGLVDKDLSRVDTNDLDVIKSINVLSSIKIKNLLLEETINMMGRQTVDLNQKLVESSMLATAGEIASSVSRELISPIKIIDANLKLIETGIGSPARRIEIIKNQLTLIQSLNKRFDSILPGTDSEKISLNICEVINEIIEITQSQLYESNIKPITDFETGNFLISGSKSILEQIILNLLMNSIDAMPDGGEITFGVYHGAGAKAVINIADNGIGIPEEISEKIFEPYFTTKNESRKLGMGLYLTQLLVTKLRGKISFSSVIGKGTTFKIILPMVKESAKT